MRQPPQRAISCRCSLQPPLLLTLPFAVLAGAAVRAGTPFTPKHVAGTTALLILCGLSLFCGIRRRSNAESALDPSQDAIPTKPAHQPAQRVTIDRADLAESIVISCPGRDAQFKVALAFGVIAFSALIVVLCLFVGQLRRAGPITPFGLLLALFLVMVPAVLACHVALSRFVLRIACDGFHITLRQGILGSTHLHWMRNEIRAIELTACPENGPVTLAVLSDARSPTFAVRGLDIAQVKTMLLTGSVAQQHARPIPA